MTRRRWIPILMPFAVVGGLLLARRLLTPVPWHEVPQEWVPGVSDYGDSSTIVEDPARSGEPDPDAPWVSFGPPLKPTTLGGHRVLDSRRPGGVIWLEDAEMPRGHGLDRP
ncbi:hypothetical protein EPO04_00640 [Patescibacteria group bacterium]|nr:MAG: hypothetical protein EPO04_00640 [Patescibacteria group bacterium]